MNKALRLSAVTGAILALTGILSNASAQVTITSSDILSLIGKTETVESDTSSSTAVTVGATGGPQMWDFGAIALNSPIEQTFHFLAPEDTPFGGDFPNANFVQYFVFADTIEGFGTFKLEAWNFSEARSDSFNTFGSVSVTTSDNPLIGTDTTFTDFREGIAFPVAFNSTWTDSESDTSTIDVFVTVSNSSASNIVDAFGTVKIGDRSFECLRICSFDTTSTQQFINGVPLGPPTISTSIDYSWVSKASFNVASISSQDDETDPNFTDAFSFFRIKGGATTSVSENDGLLPTTLNLMQNYPNPFNPETRIDYSIGKQGLVDLAIFDINGALVKNLVQSDLAAGEYSAVWDGTDFSGRKVASGRYVYRLTFNGEVKSKMMILVK